MFIGFGSHRRNNGGGGRSGIDDRLNFDSGRSDDREGVAGGLFFGRVFEAAKAFSLLPFALSRTVLRRLLVPPAGAQHDRAVQTSILLLSVVEYF